MQERKFEIRLYIKNIIPGVVFELIVIGIGLSIMFSGGKQNFNVGFMVILGGALIGGIWIVTGLLNTPCPQCNVKLKRSKDPRRLVCERCLIVWVLPGKVR